MTESNEKTTPGQEIAKSDTNIVEQPQELVNDYDIDGFLQKRQEFIEKVNAIMVEKADYHVIQGRKSLGKGGAEKIVSIFGWQASFKKDQEVLDMLGTQNGIIALVCTLTKNGVFIGEGRGARNLAQDKDINKAIKMAEKSAFIDATLRASGLSDFFTQDLEDMAPQTPITQNIASNEDRQGAPKAVRPASAKQIGFIKGLMEQKGVDKDDPKIKDKLETLTSADASAWIDKLNKMEDKERVPTITYDDDSLPEPVIGVDTPK